VMRYREVQNYHPAVAEMQKWFDYKANWDSTLLCKWGDSIFIPPQILYKQRCYCGADCLLGGSSALPQQQGSALSGLSRGELYTGCVMPALQPVVCGYKRLWPPLFVRKNVDALLIYGRRNVSKTGEFPWSYRRSSGSAHRQRRRERR
jgi:hypothetical protein